MRTPGFFERTCMRIVVGFALVFGLVSLPASASVRDDLETAATGRSFLYLIGNPDGPNFIAAYERDPQTGGLRSIGTYPTGGRGSGRSVDSQSPLVASPDGSFIFAVNPASNDLSVMAVRPDGSLELVGSPVASRGITPASLAINGNLLYVANKGDAPTPPNYSGFRIGAGGVLTRVKRRITLNIGDNPTQVLFNRDGSMLVGLRLGGRVIDCLGVTPSGRLRPLAELSIPTGPFAGVFSPADPHHLLVADVRLPGAASYFVSDQGQVSPITAVSNAPERAACWIAVHGSGEFFWVVNTGTNSLSMYRVDAAGRIAVGGTHSTLAFGRVPFEIALDGSNQFLYELNTGAGYQSVHVLRVTPGSGNAGLEDVAAFSIPPGSAPMGLAIVER